MSKILEIILYFSFKTLFIILKKKNTMYHVILVLYFVQGFNNITRLEIKIPTKN